MGIIMRVAVRSLRVLDTRLVSAAGAYRKCVRTVHKREVVLRGQKERPVEVKAGKKWRLVTF
jgi:hypothetical protein